VTATYGDVTGEYLALRREAGFVSGSHDLVWAAGGDTVSFLDGLLSQDIDGIAAGESADALLLAPQGKLRATLRALRGADRVGLIADRNRGDVVLGDLTRFKLRVDVDLAADARPQATIWGPHAAQALGRLGLPVPGPAGWSDADGRLVAALPLRRVALPRFFVAGIDADEAAAAGVRPVGDLAAAAVRIEAGEPAAGADIDEGTIPQEADLVATGVDFDKGCYLGQELVARIDSRGRVNRILRGVVVTDSVIPPPGAEILWEGKAIGSLGTVGESLHLRAPVALALVRREPGPGTAVVLRWEGGSAGASIEELPLDPSL
jgi:folate-binding protein YgfZ